MIGTTIGNYRVVRQLGMGGMGAVYEGLDAMLERPVAIKVLRPELAAQPELIERFRSEAVTLARLNHPGIAMLYSFFESGGQYFMVMEFVRGRTLETILKEFGPLAPKAAAGMLRQVLDALAHAHGMGVLHRDIKPANIMLNADGTVKVTDFGIARILGSSRMTREGRIVGTLEYIAPERIRGEEADARSDLYSAGVVLFEALAGRLPFISNTDFGLMEAHLRQEPPRLPALGVDCPPALEAVLRKALAKTPEERFRSAQEFRDTLAEISGSTPAGGTSVPSPLKPTRLAVSGPAIPETRLAGAPAGPVAVPVAAAAPARHPQWMVPAAVASGTVLLAVLGIFGALHLRDTLSGNGKPPEPVQQTAQVPVQPPPAPPQQQESAPVFIPAPTKPAAEFKALPLNPPSPVAGSRPAPVEHATAPPHAQPSVPVQVPAAPAQVPAAPVQAPTAPVQPPQSAPAVPQTGPRIDSAPAPTTPAQPTKEVPPVKEAAMAKSRPKNIRSVRMLFVERMPNDLDRYIKAEIQSQLGSRLEVASTREQADAVMKGSSEKRDGLGGKLTGGFLGMKARVTGNVTITDVDGVRLLWTGEAGDAKAMTGAIKRGGVQKVAERLVGNLKQALTE